MITYRDRKGYLHNKPVIDGDLETSENGPFYDGVNIAVEGKEGMLPKRDACKYLNRVDALFGKVAVRKNLAGVGEVLMIPSNPCWKVTPESTRCDFSRDNWDGLFAGLQAVENNFKENKVIMDGVKDIKRNIPIFHKQRKMFIRDIPMVIGFKYKWTRYLGIMIPRKIACIISCYQSHKNKGTLAKTDGKIMALALCWSFGWKRTFKICDSLIRNRWRKHPFPSKATSFPISPDGEKWRWGNWTRVFLDHFENDEKYPTTSMINWWEETKEEE